MEEEKIMDTPVAEEVVEETGSEEDVIVDNATIEQIIDELLLFSDEELMMIVDAIQSKLGGSEEVTPEQKAEALESSFMY